MRAASRSRREQIIDATLGLLSDIPLREVTTRQIATAVDLSQPALFRHFPTRAAIFTAVIERTRMELGEAVERLFEQQAPPLSRVRSLIGRLLDYTHRYPGLVRLLLADDLPEPSQRVELDHLRSMQRSLIEVLVLEAQAQSEVPASVSARGASALLVAILQGSLIAWLQEGRKRPIAQEADRLFEFWRAGLLAGLPASAEAPRHAPVENKNETSSRLLDELDLAPMLSAGEDPLTAILERLRTLSSEGALLLKVPFEPKPLMALLKDKGHPWELRRIGKKNIALLVFGLGAPALSDLSDLPAPEPLERVLHRAAMLPALGDSRERLLFRLPQLPHLLLPRLAPSGFEHRVLLEPDGTALLLLWRHS